MIAGVKINKLKVIPDERGRLVELLRCDDDLFQKFGQVYLTTTYPGVVKAWHLHTRQTDNIVCVRGMIKLVLFDPREDSPTLGEVEQIYLGVHNPLLVQVPPDVYHGWKCISQEEAYMVNCPTEPYDREHPDEYRLPPDTPQIDYDWARVDR